MVFLLLVVDGGSGSAASANQASTLQLRGESKGGRAVYRLQPVSPPTQTCRLRPFGGLDCAFDLAHNHQSISCY